MLRVPDGRAGVCSRVGVLSRGQGVLVNRCQQCLMWQAGGCACCWVHWGQEIVYFGGSRVQ